MVERKINDRSTSTAGFENLYPFESCFLNLNGNALHYIDQGTGKPVMMVHGNPTWSFYYRNLVNSLSPRGYRCIVPDHIGCGFSDKPGEKEYSYTLKSRVQDLDALIAHLDIQEKISLILHDWGGMIGLAWAVDHIDRIDKLIITNTAGFFLPREKRFPFRLWLIKYLRFFAVPAVLGANLFSVGALYFAAEKSLSPDVKKGLIAPYNCWKNRIATLKFVQDIPISEKDESYSTVDHVDRHLDRLKKKEILLLWGAKDFVFDLTFFAEFIRRFPNAQAKVFENAGHYLFEDRPTETDQMIRQFLAQ